MYSYLRDCIDGELSPKSCFSGSLVGEIVQCRAFNLKSDKSRSIQLNVR